MKKALLLFDGVCNLCNASVRFIIKRDKKRTIQFANLQSEYAVNKLKDLSISEIPDSIIFIKGNKVLYKSDAAFEILKSFSKPWQILVIFKLLPKSIKDCIYDIVAKYRYKIFGKKEFCEIPDESISDRFIGE
jgi:predicted DCC family thiol-disulfide oxidoreductase YuxK